MKPPFLLLQALLFSAIALGQSDEPQDARRRILEIEPSGAKSIPDFIERCQKMSALLPLLDSQYKKSDSALRGLRQKYSGNAKAQAWVTALEAMNERDRFGFVLLREEVRRANILAHLPAGDQQAYYDSKIVLVQKLINDVAEEEVELTLNARKQGVPLPDDVLKQLDSGPNTSRK